MSSGARQPQRKSNTAFGGRHRGLFLVPKGSVAEDLSRGEAPEDAYAMDSLAHARRIVEQVEREIEQKAARERTMRMRPVAETAPRPGFWMRAARAMGF